MWQDSGKTTPVTADGQQVGLWESQINIAENFRQTNNAFRPVWRAAGYLEFTGRFLFGGPSLANLEANGGTVLMRVEVLNNNQGAMLMMCNSSIAHWQYSNVHYPDWLTPSRPAAFNWGTVAEPINSKMTYCAAKAAGSSPLRIYLENNLRYTSGNLTTSRNGQTLLSVGATLGGSWQIASARLFAMLIYDIELSAADRLAGHNYISQF